MEYQTLTIIYRGHDLTRAADGSYTITKDGALIATAKSEDAAMTTVDALRRAKAKGAA